MSEKYDDRPGVFIDGNGTRQPLPAETLKPLAAGLIISAFSSVPWLMDKLQCTREEAVAFKVNAQWDFESMMSAARQAMGRMA
jgi:hypothetical protein